ncbi:MAG: 2-hydroxyacyl-CoA dehydratase family protein [Atribacterota bacterium]
MDRIPKAFLRILRFCINRPTPFRLLKVYEWWLRRTYPQPDLSQFSWQTTMHTICTLYGRTQKVAWASLFFPSEFLYAASLAPFYPEIATGLVGALGFAHLPLEEAERLWFSQDLCSYHRGSLGMSFLGFFPKPDFLFATSTICQGTVGFFETLQEIWKVPLFLVDVPKEGGPRAKEYVALQLAQIAQRLEKEWRVRFFWDEAFALSNKTREVLREVARLRQRSDRMLLPPTKNLDYLPYYYEFLGSRIALSFAEKLKARLSRASPTLPHRLIWLHLKPFYMKNLSKMLEELELGVVFEEFTDIFPGELSPSSPFLSLAEKILWANEVLASAQGRVSHILKALKMYDAEGAIQFTQWGCRQSQGMTSLLRKALLDAGYPVLTLDGDHLDRRHRGEEGLRTRLEAFREML